MVLVDSRTGKDVTPEIVASHVGLSARQFSRLFQEQRGMTPKTFIIETRLRHAKWLAPNGSLSMTAIAYETGGASHRVMRNVTAKYRPGF